MYFETFRDKAKEEIYSILQDHGKMLSDFYEAKLWYAEELKSETQTVASSTHVSDKSKWSRSQKSDSDSEDEDEVYSKKFWKLIKKGEIFKDDEDDAKEAFEDFFMPFVKDQIEERGDKFNSRYSSKKEAGKAIVKYLRWKAMMYWDNERKLDKLFGDFDGFKVYFKKEFKRYISNLKKDSSSDDGNEEEEEKDGYTS